MTEEKIADLIPIGDAMKLVGRSRTWIVARCKTYQVERYVMVSKAEVVAANVEYKTPKEIGERDGDNIAD